MPIILHVDFNSFFASVEQQANPFLRGKAIGIAGKGRASMDGRAHDVSQFRFERSVITTASREAKKLGVKTAMSTFEAKQIVPDLQIIPGDPRKYAEITKRFLAILREHTDAVEQFSADEAFADITVSAKDYFGAIMLAQVIRDDIKKICGEYCTASIGIGPNKLIAKLAGESVKPNGLTVVQPHEVEDFVLTRKLEDICGIGHRIAKRLKNLSIESIADLRATPKPILLMHFKSYGNFLYDAARGKGSNAILAEPQPEKSIGHSYTFPENLDTEIELQTNLLALCDKVSWRLRRAKAVGGTIAVFARYADFTGVSTIRRLHIPLWNGLDIYKCAWQILEDIRDPHCSVRLLGVSISGLEHIPIPTSLFKKDQKILATIQALDRLQERYGGHIWQRANALGTFMAERVSGWHYDHELLEAK
ncbi:MAG: DNA polymerase IV [Patescibacteria group bacterium]